MLTAIFIIVGIIALGAYFFPTIVSFIVKSDNKRNIFLINLFLGWSFFGWVVALVLCFYTIPYRS